MAEESFATILLFFIYTWGLGFSITSFAKPIENFFERNVMRIAIGLVSIPVISVILSLVRVPLDWRVFLVISMAYPLYVLSMKLRSKTHFPKPRLKVTKSGLYFLLVFLMFSFTLFMYVKGSFVYPYLDDDDSWNHAVGIKYVSIEKTVFNPNGGTSYLDPYPPAYDTILGILKQTSPYMIWTIKFFNSLMISLSILFFYFLVKRLTANSEIALYATFILTMLPSYLSHFTWSHALAPVFLIIAFYSFEVSRHEPKWVYITAIPFAAIFLLSYDQALKFLAFVTLYFIVILVYSGKQSIGIIKSTALGMLLFAPWVVHLYFKFGSFSAMMSGVGLRPEQIASLSIRGTADRVYTFNDFLYAKMQNLINQPIGIGIVISILAMVGIVFVLYSYRQPSHKENNWKLIAFLWLIFTILGLYGIPRKLFPFRFWMLLAIPLSILAAYGMWSALDIIMRQAKNKMIVYLILAAIAFGIWNTSGIQKYTVNTAYWPPGAFWTSNEEIQSFISLKSLPVDTPVFSYVAPAPLIAYDKFMCNWCKESQRFRKTGINMSAADVHSWLKSNNYQYIIIEGQFARWHGSETANQKISAMVQSGLFIPVHQSPGAVVFKVQ